MKNVVTATLLGLGLTATLWTGTATAQSCVDPDSDGICSDVDSCPWDVENDAEGDNVCTQCCGIFLGPNSGNNGEYEVQVDLSGDYVSGTAESGVWTVRAYIYVTEDWDGTDHLLHSRAWDGSGSVITAIGGDNSGATRGEWNWVEADIDCGDSTPYRVSIYFGYPMKSYSGYVLASNLELVDPDGLNWIPDDGSVSCGYGLHEGRYHGSSDSYGNVGIAENACEYDDFDFGHLFNCNDIDSDFVCSPEDTCFNDGNDDADGDNICGDVDSCPGDPKDDADGDGICTQCCGIYLGPNGGNYGEYEVQIDLSGEAPAVSGTAGDGVYTIRAYVYVTEDWDGTASLLHARAWDSSSR